MSKLRRLSGKEVIKILGIFGFSVVSQKGSHVKLKRMASAGEQTLTIPLHKQLDRGTAHAIFTQACRYIDESELRKHFYTK